MSIDNISSSSKILDKAVIRAKIKMCCIPDTNRFCFFALVYHVDADSYFIFRSDSTEVEFKRKGFYRVFAGYANCRREFVDVIHEYMTENNF